MPGPGDLPIEPVAVAPSSDVDERGRRRSTRAGARLRTTLLTAVGSLALTAIMSALFNHGHVRSDMLFTGGVCALVLEPVIGRMAHDYRRKLAAANQALERRVSARTADLAAANASLREAAAAQAALRDELLARDRLATAGMLAAGVSHEIRSPLTVISMGVDEIELSLDGAGAGALRPIVADLRAASEQIAVVVRDLSALARPACDPVGTVALAPVIATAVRLAGYQLHAGATVVLGDVTDAAVTANASRLVQVVLNLLTNAARATRPAVANTIAIAATAAGDTVALRVTDTGCGMSPETQARLFTPFFTTCADRGGTGLGLSICRTIIERMGGSIAVESAVDEGTTVTVLLPRATARA